MYIQAQSERQGYTLVACRKVGSPKCLSKRAGGEFVVDSRASMPLVVSEKDLKLCWVGDHEDIKESDDGDDGQRRGANKKRSYGICATIGLVRHCYASSRNSRQRFHWGNSAGNMGTRITGKAVKNPHLIRNGKRNDCNVSNSVYRLWFLEYQRVLPQLRLHLPRHHLHHRSRHRLTERQCQKTEVWSCSIPQKPKTKIKIGNRKSTKRYIAWIAWLATGIQGEFGWWKHFRRASERRDVEKCRHFSWISNGAASILGTRFG